MRRLVPIFVTVLLIVSSYGLTSIAQIAHADTWCEDDPRVQINGLSVNITVGVASGGVSHVQGAVPIAIVVPNGAKTSIGAIDSTFFTENVRFFTYREAYQALGFLGLSGAAVPAGMLSGDSHDRFDRDGRSGQVYVLSVVHGDQSFATHMFTSQSTATVDATANQLMVLSFGLRDR